MKVCERLWMVNMLMESEEARRGTGWPAGLLFTEGGTCGGRAVYSLLASFGCVVVWRPACVTWSLVWSVYCTTGRQTPYCEARALCAY